MFILNSLIGNLIATAVTVAIIFFTYCKWSFQYWQRKKVPYLKPEIPFGNITETIKGKKNFGIAIKDIYIEMKRSGWKHGGIYSFTSPNYVPVDLDILKNIMTKDFQYFTDRTLYYNEKEDPLNAHLVNLCGPKWRNLRTKLTPTFTSGKMKMMFETLAECRGYLLKKMDEECLKREPIDIKEILSRFTTDVIGSCAFGLNFKTFEEDGSPFRIYGRRIFESTTMKSLSRRFSLTFPKVALLLNLCTTPKEVTEFFTNMVKDVVDYRERSNFVRNDFMQLLIDLKNGENGENLTIEEIAAQCYIFFLAGFETSSTLMTFALYEISRNPEIQQKIRDEMERVSKGKITYESLQEMKYLNQAIDETLRMYPPIPSVNRKCVKDYKVPDEDLIIEKGTTVIIPIMGVHYDEETYPEPEKFDPERFSEENKNSRHGYAHIPFGEGPRICIGSRFALMQVKVGLSCLIKNYKFTVNEKTLQPLKMKPANSFLAVVGEIWLNAQKV